MGFFSGIAARGQSALSALTKEAPAIQSNAARTGMMAMMALVAGADGEVEPEEAKAIFDFMKDSDLFAGQDRAKLAETMKGFFAKATDNFVREDLVEHVAKLRGTPAAPAVMRIGVHVAAADGEVEPGEKEVLLLACNALGLDPTAYPKIAA